MNCPVCENPMVNEGAGVWYCHTCGGRRKAVIQTPFGLVWATIMATWFLPDPHVRMWIGMLDNLHLEIKRDGAWVEIGLFPIELPPPHYCLAAFWFLTVWRYLKRYV